MMSESEAWAYLALRWADAKLLSDGMTVAFIRNVPCIGICLSIESMVRHHVSRDTADKMKKKIKAMFKNRHCGEYIWPLTTSGAKSRATFCRKMARLTAPKKRKTAKKK